MPGSNRPISSSAKATSELVYAPTTASKIACVPHSANATSRAWGNADFSPFITPGRPKNAALTGVSATSTQLPSIATIRRPASHTPAISGVPIGLATRANKASNGFDPSRALAWKIADFDGAVKLSAQPEAHDSPSVSWLSTSSYEPSEYSPIPIAKYAITRAGNDRRRCSVRPSAAITSSTRPGGNTRVNTPTDTRSDNRRSETGFTHPERGMPTNYTVVSLT